MNSVHQLEICLFGGMAVTLDGQPVTKFRSAKTRALLAYLAARPDQPHERTYLATLLWDEYADSAAKTNLRIELSNLKKLLNNHPALEISRNTVTFYSEWADVDVTTFQRGVADFLALPSESQSQMLAKLQGMLALYNGEFLAGFQVNNALTFTEWQLLTQEQLHEQAMRALDCLQQRYAQQGSWVELATAARQQLAMVPWQENAHRYLIQALAAQGKRGAALEQYERCRALLLSELGVEPTTATQELVARLRRTGATTATPTAVRHNLPQQLKSMVGRDEEIRLVGALVRETKLVTLQGLGGVGKSRLALAVAQAAIHDFVDGVWFVPLANIPTTDNIPDYIALAIAAALHYPMTEAQTPLTELTAHLADKKLLLILDNWDEITEAAEELCAQLLANPDIHILATSRVRLQVEEERVVQLRGLAADEGIALFVERARRIVPTFVSAGQAVDIKQICIAVGGLPLGIELAASWVEHFAVAEIGQSLREIAAAPNSTQEHVPRHRTLDSVFAYSWQLLSPLQQQLLARLAIFHGGFDREAVAAVAEGNLSDLSLLIAHSLVQRLSAGRYDLHPLVQEFAGRQLPVTAQATLDLAYSQHYLTLLRKNTDSTQLLIDFENIRSAWQRAVALDNETLLEPALKPFGEFMARFGYLPDAYQLFTDAVTQFASGVTTPGSNRAEFVAQLINQQWRCSRAIHGLPGAEQYLHRLLTFTKNPDLLLRTYLELATKCAEVAAWEEAEHYFALVEALAQQSSDPQFHVLAVESPVHIRTLHFRGDYKEHIDRLTALLAWLDALPDHAFASEQDQIELRRRTLNSLGMGAIRYGDYGTAIATAQQTLAMYDTDGRHPERNWTLLDLALAEQFAGLYAEAIAHNKEALVVAEETGATDDIGLLSANLCLTLRQGGDLCEGLRYGLAGVEALRAVGLTRMEGQARNRVGHTLLALERWEEAEKAYREALRVWAPLKHPNRYEAVAGRAVALYELQETAAALTLVEEVEQFVATEGLTGIVEPLWLLLNCERVLSACGEQLRSRAMLQQAVTWVETIAGRIRDDAVRNAFLIRPDNRLLAVRLAAVDLDATTTAQISPQPPAA